MKRYFIILLTLIAAAAFTGCDDDPESDTVVEYFPLITDGNGESISDLFLEIGSDYKVTYKATYGDGTDATSKLKVQILDGDGNPVDAVSTAASGLYTVSYYAPTSTGLSDWTENQTIIIYDPASTVDISGTYVVDLDKTLSQDVGGRFEPKDDKTKFLPLKDYVDFFGSAGPVKVTLSKYYPGVYEISDAYFGWYDQVRAYGAKYRAKGYISLGQDNSIRLLSADLSVFGGSLDPFVASYDPDTKSISFAYSFGTSVNIKEGVATLPSEPVKPTVSFTIVYNANNNLGDAPVEQVVTSGDGATMLPNTFANAGYKFTGWNTKADGSGVQYEDESEISDWATVDGAVFTLYAQWEEESGD